MLFRSVVAGSNLHREVPFIEYALFGLAVLVDVYIIMCEMRLADIAVGSECGNEIEMSGSEVEG